MRFFRHASAAALTVAVFAGSAMAQDPTHTFDVGIESISVLSLSTDAPSNLLIVAPEAGQDLAAVSESAGTYAYTNNVSGMAIWVAAAFDVAKPSGLALKLTATPDGGSPVEVTLGGNQELVAIGQETGGGSLEYELSAALTDGPYDSEVVVTFTIAAANP